MQVASDAYTLPTFNISPRETGFAEIPNSGKQSQQKTIKLAYEIFGEANNPTLLLIMGLGTQMVAWNENFIEKLVAGGLQVIRFDNRDIGLSSKIRSKNAPKLPLVFLKAKLGLKVDAPYSLEHMADDTAALLDYLKIPKAHIMGASMGGMIAQLVAIHHPEKTESLISVMSTTGSRHLPLPKRQALLRFFQRPANQELETLLAFYTQTYKIIGSPGYRQTDAELTERVHRGIARSYYPAGTIQQLMAVMASPNRSKLLRKVSLPAHVIHGDADPLVRLAHGRHTAKQLPNATLDIVKGMGHDLPPLLYDRIANSVLDHVKHLSPHLTDEPKDIS